MGGAKKSTWIGGTVFVGLVIAAAAWFLAISPALAVASDLREETRQARERNDMLEMRVTKLAAEFEKLPEYRAALEGLRTQVPATAELASYLRQIDTIATARSVTLTAVSPGIPQAVVLAAPTEVVADPAVTEQTTSTEGGDTGVVGDTSATTQQPVAPVAPQGFTAIPFTLTVLGSYDNTLAFLSDLQTATPRLFLVSGLVGTSQADTEAGSGKPATVVGDQELQITGMTYVLTDTLTPVVPADPETPAPALPGAVPGKNPLVPIDGR